MVADCNAARLFGFISDESTDCSTKEQASICVRCYDKNAKAAREEFLGFTDAKRTIGEALADLFLRELEQKGKQVDKMRARGHDSAANISGIRRAVRARSKKRVPKRIIFTVKHKSKLSHCTCLQRDACKKHDGHSPNNCLCL